MANLKGKAILLVVVDGNSPTGHVLCTNALVQKSCIKKGQSTNIAAAMEAKENSESCGESGTAPHLLEIHFLLVSQSEALLSKKEHAYIAASFLFWLG